MILGAVLLLAPIAAQTAAAKGSLLEMDPADPITLDTEPDSQDASRGAGDDDGAGDDGGENEDGRARDEAPREAESPGDNEPRQAEEEPARAADEEEQGESAPEDDRNGTGLFLSLDVLVDTECLALSLVDGRCSPSAADEGAPEAPGPEEGRQRDPGVRTAPASSADHPTPPAEAAQRSGFAETALKSVSGPTLLVLLAWTLFVASPGRSAVVMVRRQPVIRSADPEAPATGPDLQPVAGAIRARSAGHAPDLLRR